jgi:NADH-quinone oxidoreductase subunit M
MGNSFLLLLVLVPLLGTLFIALSEKGHSKSIALVCSVLTLLLSFGSLLPSGNGDGPFYNLLDASWLPALGIHLRLGVDGVSGWLIVLTSLLGLGVLLCPYPVSEEKRRVYFGATLALIGLLNGAFAALDLVLFYLFFEACLLPVYFLIGLFGGARKRNTAQKFLIFSVIGALGMLASILGVYAVAGTFDVVALRQRGIPGEAGALLFLGFAVAFAIKTPLFPLHTWQADTYAETPTPVVALVGGAMAKLGTYGFYRFCLGIFPEASAQYGPLIVWIAVAGIVYAGLIAAVQKDLKRLMAFSSVSHLGFIVMGLFSGNIQGVTGACVQMVNHGIIVGGLFLLLAYLENRRGTLKIHGLGGLWDQMPIFARIFLLFTLASVALPLTNGFVGEFLMLLGTFKLYPAAAAVAVTGVIWSAIYMLGMYQRVFYGTPSRQVAGFSDLSDGESGLVAPLAVLIFLLGIFPMPLLATMSGAIEATVGATK